MCVARRDNTARSCTLGLAPMSEAIFEHLSGVISLILFVWSGVLIWASWQIGVMARALDKERRELRRWKRLELLRDRQRKDWQ